jgi:hypothetical protein
MKLRQILSEAKEITQKRRAELAQKVEEAFAEVTYPGDGNIGTLSVEDFVSQKDWKEIPLEILLRNHAEIPAFTPEAYLFYVPAFLSALLRHPDADIMLDFVTAALIPSPSPDTKHLVEYAIELFSDLEKRVILELLERYSQLFPQSNYAIMDDGKSDLQRAIDFWQKNQR